MIKKITSNFIGLSIVLTIFQFLILSFLKYYLNDLTIINYKLNYTGNILNISFTVLLVIGLLILKLKKNTISNARKYFLILTLLCSIVMLTFVFLSAEVFTFQEAYIFSFQIKKIYMGFFFIISEVIIIYLFSYVWGLIFNFERLHELRTFFNTAFFIVLLLLFSIFFVWNITVYEKENFIREHFKYAFIPGAAVWKKERPSPIFEGRIRKAFDLYQKKKIDKIILTGGNAPGEISEAEAAFKYLIKLGVNKDDMIIENKTSTTTEQIRYLKNFVKRFDNEIILIISDSFHLPRIMEMNKFFDINSIGVASEHKLSFSKTFYFRLRESLALLLFWLFAI